MRLSFVAREVPIGRLRADIVARDEAGRRVIIEAQFGPSDHQHLGQIVTYACASQADVIVWVVTSGLRGGVRAEHVTTLAKPNEAFAGSTEFRAVEATYTSDPRPWGTLNAKPWPLTPRMRIVI
jgi:RecB family endonuclease NucS